jgi:hypothetical protein
MSNPIALNAHFISFSPFEVFKIEILTRPIKNTFNERNHKPKNISEIKSIFPLKV